MVTQHESISVRPHISRDHSDIAGIIKTLDHKVKMCPMAGEDEQVGSTVYVDY